MRHYQVLLNITRSIRGSRFRQSGTGRRWAKPVLAGRKKQARTKCRSGKVFGDMIRHGLDDRRRNWEFNPRGVTASWRGGALMKGYPTAW